MTNDQIDETLQRREAFANFIEQLEPLTPGLDEALTTSVRMQPNLPDGCRS